MTRTLKERAIRWVAVACAGLFCLGLCRVGHTTDVISPAKIIAPSDPFVQLQQTSGTPYDWTVEADEVQFSVRDLSAGQFPFQINAGALSNSMRIGNNRLIGFGTSTPERNLHIAVTAGAPTIRFQDPTQDWDIEADALGFDLVSNPDGANTRPFTVLPDAPTASLFVAANGRIGMGTATPASDTKLDIRSSGLLYGFLVKRTDAGSHYARMENPAGAFRLGVQASGDAQLGALNAGKQLALLAGGTSKIVINASGQFSFGNPPPAIPPTDAMITSTGAHLTITGNWTNNSSRAAKQDIEPITSEQARETVRALQPMTYRYKVQPDEPYAGFIAEDVPELVATSDRKSLAPMDFVAVLTKVVQDQDTQLDQQRQELGKQQEVIAQQQKLLEALNQRLAALEQKQPAP